jgi:hypothetical protein
MNEKWKWGTAGRLRRGAVILGVVGLAAGAAVMTAGSALAANGTGPGQLTLNPPSGAVTVTPTGSTSTGCPTGFQGSAQLEEFNTDGTPASRISTVVPSPVAPFNLTLPGNIGALLQSTNVTNGGTVEFAVGCYSQAAGTGSVQFVQSTFVTLDATGANYSTSATVAGPVGTTTSLTASPNPAAINATVTLNATVVQQSGTTVPTGSVQFQASGSNIGAAVPVSATGTASTTTTFPTAGSVTLTAVFTPTGNFTGSSGTFSEAVGSQAATGNNPVPVTFTVGAAGTLSVSVATGSVALNVTGQTATGTLPNVTVTDTRNTFPGWSVSGQEATFVGSGTAAGATMSGDQLGWAPAAVGTLTSGVLVGPTVAPAAPGIGTTPGVLAHVPAGSGVGTNVFNAGLNLLIPAIQKAGDYAGSINITYVATGS